MHTQASFSHRSPCHQLSSDQILILGPSALLESTGRLLSRARPIHKTLCRTGKGRASSQVLVSNGRFTNHSILSFANGVGVPLALPPRSTVAITFSSPAQNIISKNSRFGAKVMTVRSFSFGQCRTSVTRSFL
ncbi:hypothetical protein Droror1_Dr00006383 [Drosera rotundifolia]